MSSKYTINDPERLYFNFTAVVDALSILATGQKADRIISMIMPLNQELLNVQRNIYSNAINYSGEKLLNDAEFIWKHPLTGLSVVAGLSF